MSNKTIRSSCVVCCKVLFHTYKLFLDVFWMGELGILLHVGENLADSELMS